MTADASAHQDRDDLFVADFYPQLGEYLAERHAVRVRRRRRASPFPGLAQ